MARQIDRGSVQLFLQQVQFEEAADLQKGLPSDAWFEGRPTTGARIAAGMLGALPRSFARAFGMFLIGYVSDNKFVGAIGFHGPPDANGDVEVGFDVCESMRGRGYATEALRLFTRHALSLPEVRNVTVVAERQHLESQRVIVKNGFELTNPGTTECWLKYYLSAQDM